MSVFGASVQRNEVGVDVPPDKQHPRWDQKVYWMLTDTNTKAADADLSSRHVHWGFKVFRHIPCIMSDLPKPNLLHTIQIGMLDHLQKWIFHFLKTHERLDKYNAIWLSVPAYHDLTPKTKSLEEVSQWYGKEMKEMNWYQLGVVTQSLQGGSPTQRPIFNRAIECTLALLEFYMYAPYKSHDDATLSYMDQPLCRVHTFNDVFLIGWAGTKAESKANALRTELMKKRKAHEETCAETWTAAKHHCIMNAWQDYICHEIDVSQELQADFSFPTIHLMSHWVEQICPYRALQQYSAERHEQAQQTNLKDSWNASNHNLNNLRQVITVQRLIVCFEIRELNLQGLTQRWENSAAACKVLPSGADLAAPLSSQSYAKPEIMGPQNRHDGKHSDGIIKDYRALLDTMHHGMHRTTFCNCTWEFPKHRSHNNMYISDEQMHAMDVCIYHGIKVQVEGIDGEHISQNGWCTGSDSWCGGNWRNDSVWVK